MFSFGLSICDSEKVSGRSRFRKKRNRGAKKEKEKRGKRTLQRNMPILAMVKARVPCCDI